MTAPRISQWHAGVADVLLGDDPRLRTAVSRTLLGLGVYVGCAALMIIRNAIEGGDPLPVRCLAAYMIFGALAFYGFIRSGWSLRRRDAALSLPQNIYAISATVLSYPLDGPMRGLSLLVVASLPFFAFLALRPRQLQQLAALSLVAFGVMMGLLAWSDPTRFDPRIEALQFIIAAIGLPCMALVLGHASRMRSKVKVQRTELEAAFQRIERLAIRDDLTGLVNRRYMADRLAEECALALRYGQPLCVVLLDLDHFKRVNDTFGHAQGDEVLKHFAKIGLANLPPGAELARWGGEEFVLLLPSTDKADAVTIIEAMRTRLARSGEFNEITVTFSAGLASGVGASARDIMERADRALYRAKDEGRNRTACI